MTNFVDKFQDLSKESCCDQGEGLIITFMRKCFGEYDAVTLAIPYLKILLVMAP